MREFQPGRAKCWGLFAFCLTEHRAPGDAAPSAQNDVVRSVVLARSAYASQIILLFIYLLC